MSENTSDTLQPFSDWFISAVIRYLQKTRTWLITPPEIAEKIGVVTSTVHAWRDGRSVPRVEQCFKIAFAFGENVQEVLNAAGHSDVKLDYSVNYEQLVLLLSHQDNPQWTQDYQEATIQSLHDASSQEFATSAWKTATDALLHSDDSYADKAERIAKIVQLWQRNMTQ